MLSKNIIYEYMILTGELVNKTDLKHGHNYGPCCLYVDVNHRIYIMGESPHPHESNNVKKLDAYMAENRGRARSMFRI